jgi:glycosyltransferase involved in cell wall biosynthesis
MKLRIYGPRGTCPGGGEKYMDALAKALSTRHDVIQVDNPGDANMVQSHDRGHGRKFAYVLQIPYGPITPKTVVRRLMKKEIRESERDCKRKKMLYDARRSDLVIVYSRFVAGILLKYHGIRSVVLYPPVEDFRSDTPKKKVILSVGRFYEKRLYNHKRQDVLIEAFKTFSQTRPDWELRLIGGMEPSEKQYVLGLVKQADNYPIRFLVNLRQDEMREQYGEASLFWSAAGYGGRGPENCEHFGISVVEAMSAGCIPLVHGTGGPVEILAGPWGGRFWANPDDLISYSLRLTKHPSLLSDRALFARKRFADFTKEKFTERALAIFQKWEDN